MLGSVSGCCHVWVKWLSFGLLGFGVVGECRWMLSFMVSVLGLLECLDCGLLGV